MFSESVILKMREIPLIEVLDRIGATHKYDSTYRSRGDEATQLLLIENQKNHFELLVTEPKFVLRKRGKRTRYAAGGGAIDLVMSLKKCSFPDAVRMLLAGEQNEKP